MVGALEFTRINTTPTILRKQIEDLRVLGAYCVAPTLDARR
jgi:hypothetical protein